MSPLIGTFCGTYVPKFIISTLNTMTIEFITDEAANGIAPTWLFVFVITSACCEVFGISNYAGAKNAATKRWRRRHEYVVSR